MQTRMKRRKQIDSWKRKICRKREGKKQKIKTIKNIKLQEGYNKQKLINKGKKETRGKVIQREKVKKG